MFATLADVGESFPVFGVVGVSFTILIDCSLYAHTAHERRRRRRQVQHVHAAIIMSVVCCAAQRLCAEIKDKCFIVHITPFDLGDARARNSGAVMCVYVYLYASHLNVFGARFGRRCLLTQTQFGAAGCRSMSPGDKQHWQSRAH